VNDTIWSTIVGTWRPGRLELYVDGWSRASSTAAATNTSALFGIYRWGWGFSTSQDFNGDIALIACFASSWTPAMVRRWHADPFGFLRPWNELPALMGVRHRPRPLDRHRRGRLPDGVESNWRITAQPVLSLNPAADLDREGVVRGALGSSTLDDGCRLSSSPEVRVGISLDAQASPTTTGAPNALSHYRSAAARSL
jgi:Concanavalin A-like lectin/glucanases superfamily